jgi:ligand-binding sensor domain-containing protein/GAF domain-containing protein
MLKIVAVGFFIFFMLQAASQDISFFHLSTFNGLSDNLVNTVARDKNGILWVGTGEGLNSFDGYTVKKIYKEEYAALGSNQIMGLVCDDRNRIWMRTSGGKITMIDEQRNFIAIPVKDGDKDVPVSFIRQTKSRGLVLFSGSKLYVLNSKDSLYFKRLIWKEDNILQHSFVQIINDENDILLLSGNSRLCEFDMVSLKVLHFFSIPGIIGAARLNSDELIITTGRDRQLLRFSLSKKKIIKDYGSLTDQYGNAIKGSLRHIRRMNDGRFIMTSGYGGVYIFDPKLEKLYCFQHDALNNRSISANNTFYVHTDSSGFVYITTRSAGLNYFNVNHQLAGYQSSFRESSSGMVFDGFINCITQHRDGTFWLGTQTGLLEWNRKKNQIGFPEFGTINGSSLKGIEEVRAICIDDKDRLWIGLNRYGITVLDKNRKVIKYINADSVSAANYLPGNLINRITLSPDNKLWVATSRGLCIIDPVNFKVDRLKKTPALKPLTTINCNNVWFRNNTEVWIGTNKGAYRYRIVDNDLTLFNVENGLTHNNALCFEQDKKGSLYIGTSGGLNILQPNETMKSYWRGNGLKNDRCLGLLSDTSDNIWIGNDNYLLRYHIPDSSFSVYDESYGLSPFGFRTLSFCKTITGEYFWGSDVGISFFYPGQLMQVKAPFQVMLGEFSAGKQSYSFTIPVDIRVPFSQNSLVFNYTAVDLYRNRNILYEYKLTGVDDNWKKTESLRQIAYSKLQPGTYTFLVRASKDGVNWIEASNPVTIKIMTPWWKSWWFSVGWIIAILLSIFLFVRSRNKKIKQQKDQLEIEQAINYFASSIYEQQNVEDILWDVTKNCIGRLEFEDCVIYLKDDEKNVLLQKACWGPKTKFADLPNQKTGSILNPLEIPVGKGITGSVALTGKAQIIADTSKDARYIVDDARRSSEIAVPIVFNGKVLGVIDSEHSKRNFFTTRHLSILSTIASLCANKIVRVKAEKEKQQAQLELLNHQRKVAEAQLKSLRLQMSPHFLFNSLNSIQQIILSGDDTNATKYLSRFSRLLRLVLLHSDKERVNLKEELEVLRLYIELESLRFKDSFQYEIICDETIDQDEIKIPTLLIQPFIENAIWHGLLHKEGLRILKVQFMEDETENIICTIEDNGIGRKAAGVAGYEPRKGKGVSVAEERVQLFNEQQTRRSTVLIEDLVDTMGIPTGTRVKIILPLLTG